MNNVNVIGNGNGNNNNNYILNQFNQLRIDVDQGFNRISQVLSQNRGNCNKEIIGKYNRETGAIDKFYEKVIDDNDKNRDILDNVDSVKKQITIDGLLGIDSIILDYSTIEDEELNIDKELLFEEEGTLESHKLTTNTKAVENVDISNVVLNISRNEETNEIEKSVIVNKNVNRSRGSNVRRRDLEDGKIQSDLNELFNEITVLLDEESLNVGVNKGHILSKIKLFGFEEPINVRGTGVLRYCDMNNLYRYDVRIQPFYVIYLSIANNGMGSLCYQKIDNVDDDYYYFGNPIANGQEANGCYIVKIIDEQDVLQIPSYEDRKIELINEENDVVDVIRFREDVDGIIEPLEYEGGIILNGIYTRVLREFEINIFGNDSIIRNNQELNFMNVTYNTEYLVSSQYIQCNYIENLNIVGLPRLELCKFDFCNIFGNFRDNGICILNNGEVDDLESCIKIERRDIDDDIIVFYLKRIKNENIIDRDVQRLFLRYKRIESYTNETTYYFGSKSHGENDENNCLYLGFVLDEEFRSIENKKFKIYDNFNRGIKAIDLRNINHIPANDSGSELSKVTEYILEGDNWCINWGGALVNFDYFGDIIEVDKIRIVNESLKYDEFDDEAVFEMDKDDLNRSEERWEEFINNGAGHFLATSQIYIYYNKNLKRFNFGWAEFVTNGTLEHEYQKFITAFVAKHDLFDFNSISNNWFIIIC